MTVGQILLVSHLPELSSWKVLRLDTPRGKLVRSGAPPLLLDAVGGGGDRDTLGGCAVGKEVGWGEMHQHKVAAPPVAGAPWGGKGKGKLGQREAATTEDTEGRDVTTEDASKGEWEGDAPGEGGRQGRIRVWRAVQAERSSPWGARQTGTQGTMLTNPQG